MKEDIRDRIGKVREHEKKSQEEFGSILGVTKSTISLLETKKREPSERLLRDICREFGVNEIWLRTGEGGEDNMFTQINPADRYSINLATLTVSENKFIQNAVNYLAEADPKKLEVLEDFMKACIGIK
ncbi:helix-turn-helix transcriptional regulator [Eisenbergiella tayi]|uniref:helix-turn-helix transcriptional regulator n=1 Tax=Eisenbergiella tayi TaxID=1432052 RepID=UPI001FA73BCB|nr:helix-turn-helix transcriptional regulator [Eisenbergiella tayi]